MNSVQPPAVANEEWQRIGHFENIPELKNWLESNNCVEAKAIDQNVPMSTVYRCSVSEECTYRLIIFNVLIPGK